ncbi:unnamed protein product, partial [Didymodactylos carnosus]
MFGRHPLLPLEHTSSLFQFNRPNDYWMQMMKAMNVYREAARERIPGCWASIFIAVSPSHREEVSLVRE